MRTAALLFLAAAVPLAPHAAAQAGGGGQLEMDLAVSDGDLALLFGGLVAAVAGILAFLARDVILRRKTPYDSADLESKRDRTYEKYHSDWNDDYEEVGGRGGAHRSEEFARAARDSALPDYYGVMGLQRDATPGEVKRRYRELAKRSHPDRAGGGAEDAMAEINEAYEVLSDRDLRARYDGFLDPGDARE